MPLHEKGRREWGCSRGSCSYVLENVYLLEVSLQEGWRFLLIKFLITILECLCAFRCSFMIRYQLDHEWHVSAACVRLRSHGTAGSWRCTFGCQVAGKGLSARDWIWKPLYRKPRDWLVESGREKRINEQSGVTDQIAYTGVQCKRTLHFGSSKRVAGKNISSGKTRRLKLVSCNCRTYDTCTSMSRQSYCPTRWSGNIIIISCSYIAL